MPTFGIKRFQTIIESQYFSVMCNANFWNQTISKQLLKKNIESQYFSIMCNIHCWNQTISNQLLKKILKVNTFQ